ncbi:MAG: hypothetical protein ACE5HS_09320 [bacterium]
MAKDETKVKTVPTENVIHTSAREDPPDPKAQAIAEFINIKAALSGADPVWPIPELDDKLRPGFSGQS